MVVPPLRGLARWAAGQAVAESRHFLKGSSTTVATRRDGGAGRVVSPTSIGLARSVLEARTDGLATPLESARMAEKRSKRKSKTGTKNEPGVLASLPATRPARMSARARAGDTEKAAAETRAKTKAASAKPAAKPRKAAATKAKAEPEPARVPVAKPARPRPVRSASKNLAEPAKKAADKRPAEDRSASGTELVATVVQAAGELAQVGLTVGGQLIKRAVEKLPKP